MSINAQLRPDQYNSVSVRLIERASIRDFMERHKHYLLKGRVLDWGCGKQPYRDLVEGEYFGHDKRAEIDWRHSLPDVIMCNQVLQYIEDPGLLLRKFAHILPDGGVLVLTYSTSWDEVEGDDDDYWRFTFKGIELLLKQAGFEIVHHERRAEITLGRFKFPLGGGVIARKI